VAGKVVHLSSVLLVKNGIQINAFAASKVHEMNLTHSEFSVIRIHIIAIDWTNYESI
jgi:hypothetical protein